MMFTLPSRKDPLVDRKIWEAAQCEERYLITQHLDFSDVRRFVRGEHHGILLIRLHSPSRLRLITRIEELFQKRECQQLGRDAMKRQPFSILL